MDERIKSVIANLEKRHIEAKYFDSREDLVKTLLEEIDVKEKVAFGGSKTLDALGLYEKLSGRGNKVLWHWRVEKEKVMDTLREALFSDVYLSSCNALIEDGRIVNIDGNGNRVAATFFGPKKVYIITGVNKLSKDYDVAIERIKTVACPMNARRLNRNTPCAKVDKCMDCKGNDRMCTVTAIIEAKPPLMDFKVYIVNEELGY